MGIPPTNKVVRPALKGFFAGFLSDFILESSSGLFAEAFAGFLTGISSRFLTGFVARFLSISLLKPSTIILSIIKV